MRWIVGLGNPGREYVGSRHNVGFAVLDLVASRVGASFAAHERLVSVARIGESAVLLKPMTYMNRSGEVMAWGRGERGLETDDLLVVVDDVWLDPGSMRLRVQGSDGGHNGLRDVARVLESDRYARLRIGVGRAASTPMVEHVLERFDSESWALVEPALERAADLVLEAIDGASWSRLMEKYNRSGPAPDGSDRGEESRS